MNRRYWKKIGRKEKYKWKESQIYKKLYNIDFNYTIGIHQEENSIFVKIITIL
jgi:capsule polysaccharide modification protein KpsS